MWAAGSEVKRPHLARGNGLDCCGGFLCGLLDGLPLEEAGHLASFCAETVIQQVGASIPSNLRELAQTYLSRVRSSEQMGAELATQV